MQKMSPLAAEAAVHQALNGWLIGPMRLSRRLLVNPMINVAFFFVPENAIYYYRSESHIFSILRMPQP